MFERLHRHVHSQLYKYNTSIRQRQVFLPLKANFFYKMDYFVSCSLRSHSKPAFIYLSLNLKSLKLILALDESFIPFIFSSCSLVIFIGIAAAVLGFNTPDSLTS